MQILYSPDRFDHKPLVALLKKDVATLKQRLQHILLYVTVAL